MSGKPHIRLGLARAFADQPDLCTDQRRPMVKLWTGKKRYPF